MTNSSPDSIRPPVYLDHCATTPVDPRVMSKMLPFFTEKFGNASSRDHSFGWDAQEAVEESRSTVARLVHASTSDVFFTASATEGINTGIKGIAHGLKRKGNHIITTSVEHDAVMQTCAFLEQEDFEVTYFPVDGEGGLDVRMLENAVRDTTILIAVMHANNETGVIFPVSTIGAIARGHGIPFFSDATQTAGKVPIDFPSCNIDIAVFSSHKIHGPKGAAALYIAGDELKRSITTLIHGGGQERNIRSGTYDVPAIVGFGEACGIAEKEMTADGEKNLVLRDLLEGEMTACIDGVSINGRGSLRLPHISNMSFAGMDARELIRRINTVAVSSTSACSSGSSEMSHVLKTMGKSEDSIRGAIRFSCGRFSTNAEIHYAINEF